MRERSALYEAAERAFARRQDADAFRAFAEVIEAPGFDADTRALARHRQGMIRLRQGQPAEAMRLLASVAGFGARERTALAALDIARMPAERAAQRAAILDVAARFPDTAAAELAVEQLAVRVMRDEAPALVDAFASLAKRHPDATLGPVATAWQAHVEWRVLADLPAARATLRRLVRRWPQTHQSDEALWLLAGLERRRGEWRRARDTYLALADEHPDRGWIPLGSERAPKADDAALWAGRITLHGMRDATEAIEVLEDALDAFGDGLLGDDMRFELAIARFAAGRPEAARDSLRAILRRDPESRHVDDARAILAGRPPPAPDPARLGWPEPGPDAIPIPSAEASPEPGA